MHLNNHFTHAYLVNTSHVEAAKHKQAKQGSLGTEVAPQAKQIGSWS